MATPKRRNEYVRHITPTDHPDKPTGSLTKQSMVDECNINLIVERHLSTGFWTHVNPVLPAYGDFSLASDLADSIAAVRLATDSFDELPGSVRAAAQNNPVQFLEMVANEEGYATLLAAGLPTDPVPEPPAGPIAPPPIEPPAPTPAPEPPPS